MEGLIQRKIPLLARRLVTILPAIAIVGFGFDATKALVLSQVVLSFGIPFALVPLLLATSSRRIMGDQKNNRIIITALTLITLIVVVLNLALIWLTLRENAYS